MVEVQPDAQMVLSMVACVTAGLVAPGVQLGSGRTSRPVPRAWQEPGVTDRPSSGVEVTGTGAVVDGGRLGIGVRGGLVMDVGGAALWLAVWQPVTARASTPSTVSVLVRPIPTDTPASDRR
jgi:hypothetical protein